MTIKYIVEKGTSGVTVRCNHCNFSLPLVGEEDPNSGFYETIVEQMVKAHHQEDPCRVIELILREPYPRFEGLIMEINEQNEQWGFGGIERAWKRMDVGL